MIQIDAATGSEVEQITQRLEELRRSFDDDVRRAPPEETKKTEEYLLLTLSGETYGLPVAHVLEVVHVPAIIPVPNVPPAVLGIVNFRGQILSVTSIHGLFGLSAGKPGSASRIIVAKGLPLVTGILADTVARIAAVAAEDVQPPPATVEDDRTRLLKGQIRLGHRVVFLLDMGQLCGLESLRATRTNPASSEFTTTEAVR